MLTTATIMLLLDQITKAWVRNRLPLHESWTPLPTLARYFSFTHTTNTGAAFGLFPDQGILFVVIAIVVSVAIVVYMRYLPAERPVVSISLGLQLGGALGNLIDRVRLGRVTDFIDFKVWPVFNLADSAIVVGVAILALILLLEKEQPETQGDDTEPPSFPPQVSHSDGGTAQGR
ncbi:MAG TPA: signal peptidase II [Anaerolineae bacterium]|nr:signal peptidase II [Anaerolineae bacterium]